ncbi:hypothetical protein RHECNPAF_1340036 [Rhizobium etli CNPAF512]|nr:hypothetical protein RHECNPAF_1340036 [Rhizobium etli CNPAF512]
MNSLSRKAAAGTTRTRPGKKPYRTAAHAAAQNSAKGIAVTASSKALRVARGWRYPARIFNQGFSAKGAVGAAGFCGFSSGSSKSASRISSLSKRRAPSITKYHRKRLRRSTDRRRGRLFEEESCSVAPSGFSKTRSSLIPRPGRTRCRF